MEGGLRVPGSFKKRGLRVLVAGLSNGGRTEDASGWVVHWREI